MIFDISMRPVREEQRHRRHFAPWTCLPPWRDFAPASLKFWPLETCSFDQNMCMALVHSDARATKGITLLRQLIFVLWITKKAILDVCQIICHMNKSKMDSNRDNNAWSIPPGVHSQEMPGTEVPLGWVAIFQLRYRDGSRSLPFGIKIGRNFCHQVQRHV